MRKELAVKKAKDRLTSRVRKTKSGCLLWRGAKYGGGYAQFSFLGKIKPGHRVLYELTYGPISQDDCVCHTCNNKHCLNIDHLYLGSRKQNTGDAAKDGLMCSKKTYLTKEQAKQVRERYKAGEGYRKIAEDYGCSHICIRNIVLGKTKRLL